jgi:hypothetical protein
MRIQSIIRAAGLAALTMGTFAAAAATGATPSATELEAAAVIRGSLGAPLTDLALDTSGGTLVFLLNAGCVLLFGAIAVLAARGKSRSIGRISFRSRNFAR